MAEYGNEGIVATTENPLGKGDPQVLDTPVETPFGVFDTKTEYETGCKVEDVLDSGAVVSFTTTERFVPRVEPSRPDESSPQPSRPFDETTTDVLIGATPEGFVMPLESEQNAGDPGAYLLRQKTTRVNDTSGEQQVVERFTYLDKADITDVVVQNNRLPIFNINKERSRNIRVQGKVTAVSSLSNSSK